MKEQIEPAERDEADAIPPQPTHTPAKCEVTVIGYENISRRDGGEGEDGNSKETNIGQRTKERWSKNKEEVREKP